MTWFARAFGLMATFAAWAGAGPAAAQSAGPLLEVMAGPSRAVGGDLEKRMGLLLEGGAATSELSAGLRLGLRLSLDVRPESGIDDCIVMPGSTNSACRAKAPTIAGLGPELRWRASRTLTFRLGGGVVASDGGDGAGAAVHVGLDLSRALGSRSRALLAVRLQTASGVAHQRVTTLGVALGLQRGFGRRPPPAPLR